MEAELCASAIQLTTDGGHLRSRDPPLGEICADHVDYGDALDYDEFGIRYDDDAVNDWALFEDGDMSQGTTNPPLLAIEYVVP